MTEAQAKTKWCPFIRANGHNANADGIRIGRCVARDCAVWQFYEYQGPRGEAVGYCGLMKG